jgi:hypothetical protein
LLRAFGQQAFPRFAGRSGSAREAAKYKELQSEAGKEK